MKDTRNSTDQANVLYSLQTSSRLIKWYLLLNLQWVNIKSHVLSLKLLKYLWFQFNIYFGLLIHTYFRRIFNERLCMILLYQAEKWKIDIFELKFSEHGRDERSNSCSGLNEDLDVIDHVQIFPSLPSDVLEEMGLTREQERWVI